MPGSSSPRNNSASMHKQSGSVAKLQQVHVWPAFLVPTLPHFGRAD